MKGQSRSVVITRAIISPSAPSSTQAVRLEGVDTCAARLAPTAICAVVATANANITRLSSLLTDRRIMSSSGSLAVPGWPLSACALQNVKDEQGRYTGLENEKLIAG